MIRPGPLPRLALILLAGVAPVAADEPPERDRITQVSVINALMLGQYDGVKPIGELLRWGDFGVGTLDHLDGELIVLDGRAYQVRGDGAVLPVGPGRSTPFAVVTPFDAEGQLPCPEVDSLAELNRRLDAAIARPNQFLAVRIRARPASITLRSVARQEPPYRPLAAVAEHESVWTHADLAGTLIGIRSPAWAVGMNVPGYHWHFLSDDRTIGGHILDCRLTAGQVEYDICHTWQVLLDDSPAFNAADLARDQSRDLKRVESAREPGQP